MQTTMKKKDPGAVQFIQLTNRYIAANAFVQHGDNWLAEQLVSRTADIVAVPAHLQQDYLKKVKSWMEAATTYLNEACRSLVAYDRTGNAKDLHDAEQFIRLMQDS